MFGYIYIWKNRSSRLRVIVFVHEKQNLRGRFMGGGRVCFGVKVFQDWLLEVVGVNTNQRRLIWKYTSTKKKMRKYKRVRLLFCERVRIESARSAKKMFFFRCSFVSRWKMSLHTLHIKSVWVSYHSHYECILNIQVFQTFLSQ